MANGQTSNAMSLTTVALIGVLAGGGSSMGLRAVAPPRPDPWTGAQAQALRIDMMAELERRTKLHKEQLELEIRRTELAIRTDMPPIPTRLRLEAAEIQIKKLTALHGDTWRPPSMQFALVEE